MLNATGRFVSRFNLPLLKILLLESKGVRSKRMCQGEREIQFIVVSNLDYDDREVAALSPTFGGK